MQLPCWESTAPAVETCGMCWNGRAGMGWLLAALCMPWHPCSNRSAFPGSVWTLCLCHLLRVLVQPVDRLHAGRRLSGTRMLSLQQPCHRGSPQCVQAVLGFQGMVGDNTTAEDMLLVRALTELLPATAGQVQVVRSFDADTMSGATTPHPCLTYSPELILLGMLYLLQIVFAPGLHGRTNWVMDLRCPADCTAWQPWHRALLASAVAGQPGDTAVHVQVDAGCWQASAPWRRPQTLLHTMWRCPCRHAPALAGRLMTACLMDTLLWPNPRRSQCLQAKVALPLPGHATSACPSCHADMLCMLQSGPTANTTTLEGQLVDSVSNNQLLNTLTALGGRPTSVQLLASVPLNSLSLQPPSPLTVNPAPPTPPPSPASSGEYCGEVPCFKVLKGTCMHVLIMS